MRQVLSKGDILVSREFYPGGNSTGIIRIVDLENNINIILFPSEAEYLVLALKELLEFKPSNTTLV